jgi:redox-sensing transcriptional repressor
MPNEDISPLTLNRLSVYLRSLRHLEEQGVTRISSQELARRFHLSAAQIRKDLAQFGDFGIRGVGYEVGDLKQRIESLLSLDREHPAILLGAGNIGKALARFPGFHQSAFRIVAILDNDPDKIGQTVRHLTIHHSQDLAQVVLETRAEIGILAVPAEAAQENYDALAAAGIRAVLNFTPVQLTLDPRVRVKSVDLLILLEELAYFLK